MMALGQAAGTQSAGEDLCRVFLVCGKAIAEHELEACFSVFGRICAPVKLLREKGVAYVRFERASSAALAIENLNGAVLNNGKGPKLKVMLAEAPHVSRGISPQQRQLAEAEMATDPDNVPPNSRLFVVVPKHADVHQIQGSVMAFPNLEYCKTDLVCKGVVFLKFSLSSSALLALEAITEQGTLAGYRVKVMLAEPKSRRGRFEMLPVDMLGFSPMQAAKLDYMDPMKLHMAAAGLGGIPDYSMASFPSGSELGNLNAALAANMNNLAAADMQGLGLIGDGSLGQLTSTSSSPVSSSANNAMGLPVSRQRLFVVVNKGVEEETLARLFRRIPGMEYCDLKVDRATNKSKGYCYVNYSTPEAAAAAAEQFNGIEFPPNTGHRIKVMLAEPLGLRTPPTPAEMSAAAAAAAAAAAGPFASPSPTSTLQAAAAAAAMATATATSPRIHAPLPSGPMRNAAHHHPPPRPFPLHALPPPPSPLQQHPHPHPHPRHLPQPHPLQPHQHPQPMHPQHQHQQQQQQLPLPQSLALPPQQPMPPRLMRQHEQGLGGSIAAPSPLAPTTPFPGAHAGSISSDPISSMSDTLANISLQRTSPSTHGSVNMPAAEGRGGGGRLSTSPVARELMYGPV